MEEYKQKEIKHYDTLAKEWREKTSKNRIGFSTDVEHIDVMKMSSYQFLYNLLPQYVTGKSVLDYGCGHGMHTTEIAKMGAREVTGIDLSEESLKIAEKRVQDEKLGNKAKFIAMDAEKLEFPENSFDIVFDGGAFSSIDINKAFPEIARVLKPGGFLIGIETLAHHPLANLKRRLNRRRGVRTDWAASHIMKMGDFRLAKKYFTIKNAYFFHFLSLIAIPFERFPGGKLFSSLLKIADTILFAIFPLLKRFAFKTVFVFQK